MRKGEALAVSLLFLVLHGGAGYRDAGPRMDAEKQPYAVLLENARQAKTSGEFERAAEILKDIRGKSVQDGRAEVEAMVLLDLGITLWDLGEMKEASDKLAEASALFQKLGDVKNEKICRVGVEIAKNYGLGKDARSGGRMKESLEYFDKAIALGRSIRIVDFELKCLRQESLTYWQLGNFESFRSCNEQGLAIAKKINHRREVARCLNNIGAYYIKIGDYSNALRTCKRALPIIRELQDVTEEVICLINISNVYRQLGELDLAIQEISRALGLDEQAEDILAISETRGDLGGTLLRRGYVNKDMEDVLKGLAELDKCLSMRRAYPPDKIQIIALANSGYGYLLLRDYDRAIDFFQRALKLLNPGVITEEYGHLLNNLGNASFYKGNVVIAKQYFLKASELFLNTNYHEVLWEAYYGLGNCYGNEGDLKRALCFFEKSIEIMERLRGTISFDTFKIGFVRNKVIVYERAIDILCAMYLTAPSDILIDELFQMTERAKAQALLESMRGISQNINASPISEEVTIERSLSREIAALNIKIASPDTSETERKALLDSLKDKEQEYLRVMSDLRTGTLPREAIPAFRNISISEAQRLLPSESSAILEYFVGEERSYLILITFQGAEISILPGIAALEASLKGFLKCLASPATGHFEGMRAGERIARELLAPLMHKDKSTINSLIIIPDGVLHRVPFEALRIPVGTEFKFLLEKYDVSYAPSISTLSFLKDRRRWIQPTKAFLGFGAPARQDLQKRAGTRDESGSDHWREFYLDRGIVLTPLRFSGLEIRKAAEVFPAQMRDVYLEDQASEDVIKKHLLGKYGIVHFACHAVSDDEHPYRSALILAPGDSGDEDGFLQLRELYDLNLDAELVVLSACQTGSGALERGEGFVGLTRGFFQAGANSVISSLWAVNDKSTAKFMEDFYIAMSRGEDKSSALRSAKLRMLRSAYSHPFFWAGFILSGDPSPVWPRRLKTEQVN